MALIVDPDDLSQGTLTDQGTLDDAVWGTPSSRTVTITSAGSNFPTIGANDYFIIRNHPDAENNGLYQESGGSPAAGSITADKISGNDPIVAGAAPVDMYHDTTTEMSVGIDVGTKEIYLPAQGNLVAQDGVTEQALYSFLKEEWRTDPELIRHAFPMIAITPEQFEFIEGWKLADDGTSIKTIKSIRNGGWSEIDTQGVMQKQFAGIISLGTFHESDDLAYYQLGNDPTDTAATTNFEYTGPVNEPILTYDNNVPADTGTGVAVTGTDTITRNDGGNFLTDGFRVGGQVEIANAEDGGNNGTHNILTVTSTVITTGSTLTNNADDVAMTMAVDNRNAFKIFLRIRDTNGKTFAQQQLSDIGLAAFENKAERFPLSNAIDLKITETDGNIGSTTPYTLVRVRYLDAAYNRDVDSIGTPRNFGIVIDVDSYSHYNGASDGTAVFDSGAYSDSGLTLGDYAGGTLTIHEGTDKGDHTISGTPVDNAGTLEITLTVALTGTESNLSFTMKRASPTSATIIEVYEKVQYQLRQAADISENDQVVVGNTADELLTFVGDSLQAGVTVPTNPAGGGSGVIIEGFDPNDTNSVSFFDNGGTERSYPFVAAGTIAFNQNLQDDTGPAKYWMFFEYTERFTNTGFGLSSPSGDTATLDSSTTDLTAELATNDYIRLTGFADVTLDGIYQITGAPAGAGPWTAAVKRIDGTTLVAEAAAASVSLDKNPIDSEDAIIVNDNGGSPITGTISGPSVAFDFDYDNNTQGGRTASTVANIAIRAIGLDVASFAETTGQITQATGLSFSVVAGLERNYSNPV